MSRWRIDPDGSVFRISFEPGIPGLSVHVGGMTGEFETTLGPDGEVRLDRPIAGDFALTVDDLHLGNPVITRAGRAWLGGDTEVAVTGEIGEVRALDDGRYELTTIVRMKGREHRMKGRGRMRLEDDTMVVTGRTRMKPRDVGVPIPRMVPLTCRTDFELRLESVTDPPAATATTTESG